MTVAETAGVTLSDGGLGEVGAGGLPGAGRLDLVRWIELPSHRDARGVLTAIEGGIDLPFALARVYFVHEVETERGGHAHRDTHQVVMAVSGRCRVRLGDGRRERSFVLDDLRRGLYIVPMLFIRMDEFSPGTVLVSLASTHYDPRRSLRSWSQYLEAIRAEEGLPERDRPERNRPERHRPEPMRLEGVR